MDASGKIVAVASKRVVVTYFTTKETDSFLLDDQLRVSADILLERFNIEDNEVLYAYEGGNIGVRRGNVVPDEGFFDFSPYFKTEISSINVILCGDEKELNSVVYSPRVSTPKSMPNKWLELIENQRDYYNSSLTALDSNGTRKNYKRTNLFSLFSMKMASGNEGVKELKLHSHCARFGEREIPKGEDLYGILHGLHHGLGHGVTSSALRMALTLRTLYDIKYYYVLCRCFVQTQCEECQMKRTGPERIDIPQPIKSTRPLERVIIDLSDITKIVTRHAPDLITTSYMYMLVCVDKFSAFTWATIVTVKDSQPIASWLFRLFLRESFPEIWQTDNGSEFVNKAMQQVTEWFTTHVIQSSLYYPQCNGQVERMNQTLKNSLRFTLAGKKWRSNAMWMGLEDLLQVVVMCLNISPSSRNPTFSPHEIFNGCKHAIMRGAFPEGKGKLCTTVDNENDFYESLVDVPGRSIDQRRRVTEQNRVCVEKVCENIAKVMRSRNGIAEEYSPGTVVAVRMQEKRKRAFHGHRKFEKKAVVLTRKAGGYVLRWLEEGFNGELAGSVSEKKYAATNLRAHIGVDGKREVRPLTKQEALMSAKGNVWLNSSYSSSNVKPLEKNTVEKPRMHSLSAEDRGDVEEDYTEERQYSIQSSSSTASRTKDKQSQKSLRDDSALVSKRSKRNKTLEWGDERDVKKRRGLMEDVEARSLHRLDPDDLSSTRLLRPRIVKTDYHKMDSDDCDASTQQKKSFENASKNDDNCLLTDENETLKIEDDNEEMSSDFDEELFQITMDECEEDDEREWGEARAMSSVMWKVVGYEEDENGGDRLYHLVSDSKSKENMCLTHTEMKEFFKKRNMEMPSMVHLKPLSGTCSPQTEDDKNDGYDTFVWKNNSCHFDMLLEGLKMMTAMSDVVWSFLKGSGSPEITMVTASLQKMMDVVKGKGKQSRIDSLRDELRESYCGTFLRRRGCENQADACGNIQGEWTSLLLHGVEGTKDIHTVLVRSTYHLERKCSVETCVFGNLNRYESVTNTFCKSADQTTDTGSDHMSPLRKRNLVDWKSEGVKCPTVHDLDDAPKKKDCEGVVTTYHSVFRFPFWILRLVQAGESFKLIEEEFLEESGRGVTYVLCQIVINTGNHYTGYLRTPSGCWVHYDDTRSGRAIVMEYPDVTSFMSEEEMLKVSVLLYEREEDAVMQHFSTAWTLQRRRVCGLCTMMVTNKKEMSTCTQCGMIFHLSCSRAMKKNRRCEGGKCYRCCWKEEYPKRVMVDGEALGMTHAMQWMEVHPHLVHLMRRTNSIRCVRLDDLVGKKKKIINEIRRGVTMYCGVETLEESEDIKRMSDEILVCGQKTWIVLVNDEGEKRMYLEEGHVQLGAAMLLGVKYVPVMILLVKEGVKTGGITLGELKSIPPQVELQVARRNHGGCNVKGVYLDVESFQYRIVAIEKIDVREASDHLLREITPECRRWRVACMERVAEDIVFDEMAS